MYQLNISIRLDDHNIEPALIPKPAALVSRIGRHPFVTREHLPRRILLDEVGQPIVVQIGKLHRLPVVPRSPNR